MRLFVCVRVCMCMYVCVCVCACVFVVVCVYQAGWTCCKKTTIGLLSKCVLSPMCKSTQTLPSFLFFLPLPSTLNLNPQSHTPGLPNKCVLLSMWKSTQTLDSNLNLNPKPWTLNPEPWTLNPIQLGYSTNVFCRRFVRTPGNCIQIWTLIAKFQSLNLVPWNCCIQQMCSVATEHICWKHGSPSSCF